MTRWVAMALLAELVLSVIDAATGSRILTTTYLVPVLALALVETGERTAPVAATAVALAMASGAWDSYFLTGSHVYRVVIVAGACALGVAGAVFRTRAVRARDRMEMLARIGEIANGTVELETALSRLATVLVPGAADLCELVLIGERAGAPRIVTRVVGAGSETEVLPGDQGTGAAPEAPGGPEAPGPLEGETAALISSLRHARAGSDCPLAAEDIEALCRAGMASAVIAPVRAANRTLAMLKLAVGPSGRRYGAEDVRFAATVGGRAALAIENARLVGELREARQRMEAIVGSLADAVTIRDVTGQLVYANAAALQMMGLPASEDISRLDALELFDRYEVFAADGGPLDMADLPSVKLLRGEEAVPLELRFLDRGSGVERWRLLKSTPLYDQAGRLEAAVTIIEDITAAKLAQRRADFLTRAADILAGSLDYEETLRNVAQLAVPEIADWCAVDLVDEHGDRQQVVAAHRDPDKVELAQRLREMEPAQLDPEQGLGRVLRTGEAQLYPQVAAELVERAARSEEHLELLRALRIRSALVAPMRGTNRIIGAMTLVNAESGRRFEEDDLVFADQLASRAAVAVENARVYSERSHIAATLQQSLLPEELPEIDGWEIASLYRPASSEGTFAVGGDFYDAFGIDDGWVLLIGDVTGKGVDAAAMTALVRHGARFVAEHVLGPEQILSRLDRSLRQQPALSLCTALCLRLTGDRVSFASAGHPLPMLVTDDGVRSVGRPGPVLGAFEDGLWPVQEVVLRPGEVLLLYTDGVTDTVGREERFGEGRLRRAMAECGPREPGELLRCLDKALSRFQVGAQADDTAALALRMVAEAQPVGVPGAQRRARD